MQYTEENLMDVRDQNESWLNAQPGLSGTGIGLDAGGRVCLKIFTSHMPPATRNQIAARLGGVPVDFEETGEFTAFGM